MNVGAAFIVDAEATELVQPGHVPSRGVKARHLHNILILLSLAGEPSPLARWLLRSSLPHLPVHIHSSK